MARSDLVRPQLFLPRLVGEQLDALGHGCGAFRSRVRAEALAAPLPEGDEAAGAIGRGRFQAFAERVGQQLASVSLSVAPEAG